MTQRTIIEHPDPRLRARAETVVDFDESLGRLVADLLETMYATKGIGLSAPQVGDPRRLLVADASASGDDPQVYVNPEIVSRARPGLVEESCLSVPGVVGNVVRATQIVVRAQDVGGIAFERELEGMDAVCLQHELDHLEGTLFIDRLSLLRRLYMRASAAAPWRRSQKARAGAA